MRSEITSVARVANVLLLRLVAGNMGVNTPASKLPVDRKHGDCLKAPRNPQKVDLCVLASFSCRVYAEMQGRKVRPVAGFTFWEMLRFVALQPSSLTPYFANLALLLFLL